MQGAKQMLPHLMSALAQGMLPSLCNRQVVAVQAARRSISAAYQMKGFRNICNTRVRGGAVPAGELATAVYGAPELYEAAFDHRDFVQEAGFLRDAYALHCGGAAQSFLELGAGPACHSIELARTGAEVVYAVELAEAMVAHARAKAAAAGVSLHLIQGDMESFQLPGGAQVDVAMLLFNTAAHLLTNEAAISCFRATAAALRPGGLFVVELPMPENLFDGVFALGDAWDAATPDGEKLIVEYGLEGDDFDPITQVTQRTVKFSTMLSNGENGKLLLEDSVAIRLYTSREIDLLARLSGFEVVGVYGALDLEVETDHEESYVLVMCLRKQA